MTHTLTLSLVFLVVGCVSCNLIRSQDVVTKDVPIPREDVDNNDLKPTPVEVDTHVLPLQVETEDRQPAKDCAKIGQFCTSHSDCCTRSCLGYMKKCVTGSGFYPDYIDPPVA